MSGDDLAKDGVPRPGCTCDVCRGARWRLERSGLSVEEVRDVIRTAYVEGRGTIARLATKYGIVRSIAMRWAKEGRWTSLRRARQASERRRATARNVLEAAIASMCRAGYARPTAVSVLLSVVAELELREAGPRFFGSA